MKDDNTIKCYKDSANTNETANNDKINDKKYNKNN